MPKFPLEEFKTKFQGSNSRINDAYEGALWGFNQGCIKWHKLEDEKPPQEGFYLVFDAESSFPVADVAHWRYWSCRNKHELRWQHHSGVTYAKRFTHWAELPQGPEEE